MRLPRSLYETKPFLAVIAGGAALVAAFYVEEAYWPEVCIGAGIVFLVYGLVLLLKRKGYRSSRSRLDFDA
jgi:hypothetical protein